MSRRRQVAVTCRSLFILTFLLLGNQNLRDFGEWEQFYLSPPKFEAQSKVPHAIVSDVSIPEADQRILNDILLQVRDAFGTHTFEWLEPWLESYKNSDPKRTFLLILRLKTLYDTLVRVGVRSLGYRLRIDLPVTSEQVLMIEADASPLTILTRLILSLPSDMKKKEAILDSIAAGRPLPVREEITSFLNKVNDVKIQSLVIDTIFRSIQTENKIESLIDVLAKQFPDMKRFVYLLSSMKVEDVSAVLVNHYLERIREMNILTSNNQLVSVLRQYDSEDKRRLLELKEETLRKTGLAMKDEKERQFALTEGALRQNDVREERDFRDMDHVIDELNAPLDPLRALEYLFYFISVLDNARSVEVDLEMGPKGPRWDPDTRLPTERSTEARQELIQYVLTATAVPISGELDQFLKNGRLAGIKKAEDILAIQVEEARKTLREKEALLNELQTILLMRSL